MIHNFLLNSMFPLNMVVYLIFNINWPPKDVFFIPGDWNAKEGSQGIPRITGIWPWSTEWSRAKTIRVLPRECTGHSKYPLPTIEEKTLHMEITQMVNIKIRLTIFFAAKDGEAVYSQQTTRLGADCGSDYELLIAKFRLKMKKVKKITRSFRYYLNQIPYNYTVEMRNKFKG